jgi:hypothetical protein
MFKDVPVYIGTTAAMTIEYKTSAGEQLNYTVAFQFAEYPV